MSTIGRVKADLAVRNQGRTSYAGSRRYFSICYLAVSACIVDTTMITIRDGTGTFYTGPNRIKIIAELIVTLIANGIIATQAAILSI